jgi:hypothetical protein
VCMAVREKGRGQYRRVRAGLDGGEKFRRNHQGVFVVAGELQCEDQIRRDVGTAFRIPGDQPAGSLDALVGTNRRQEPPA